MGGGVSLHTQNGEPGSSLWSGLGSPARLAAVVLTASCPRTAGWEGPSLRSPRCGLCVSVSSGRATSCRPPQLRLLRSGLPWQVTRGPAGGDGPTCVWVVDRQPRRGECPGLIPAAAEGRDGAEMRFLPESSLSAPLRRLFRSPCAGSQFSCLERPDHPSLSSGHAGHPRKKAGAH